MAQIILAHGVSGCFGTSMAPQREEHRARLEDEPRFRNFRQPKPSDNKQWFHWYLG